MDGEISAAELRELLDADEDVRIVDIRPAAAFRRGRIPGSENVPFGELTERIEDVADADRVVTVCPHGKASVQAARLIDSYEGFSGRVDSLAEGIDGWAHDLETDERDAGPSGRDDGGETGTSNGGDEGDAATADGRRDAPF